MILPENPLSEEEQKKLVTAKSPKEIVKRLQMARLGLTGASKAMRLAVAKLLAAPEEGEQVEPMAQKTTRRGQDRNRANLKRP